MSTMLSGRVRSRVVFCGTFGLFAILMVQLHLAVHHMMVLDIRIDVMEERLRRKVTVGTSAGPAASSLLDSDESSLRRAVGPFNASLSTHFGGESTPYDFNELKRYHTALFQADLERIANAERNPVRAAALPSDAPGAPVAVVQKGLLAIGSGGAPVAPVPVPIAPVALGIGRLGIDVRAVVAPNTANTGAGCMGNVEEEPRMAWEGHWVDFGKPASDSLVRIRPDAAGDNSLEPCH